MSLLIQKVNILNYRLCWPLRINNNKSVLVVMLLTITSHMSLAKLLKTSMMLSETSIYEFVCFALTITAEHVIAHPEKNILN